MLMYELHHESYNKSIICDAEYLAYEISDMQKDDVVTVKAIELTEDDLAKLPEFDGW